MAVGREAGAMTQRERSKQARRKWQGLLSEQGRSGESVAAFCRERQLCPSHFFWWKKRLRAAEPGALRTRLRKFVEVKLIRAVPERHEFELKCSENSAIA